MTIIHTPRVIASVAKGLWKRRQLLKETTSSTAAETTTSSSSSSTVILEGIGIPHQYTARVGLLDVDYLGHMNNAAFLSHAEYARWEMTATNGLLPAMYRTNTHFMLSSASVRYRAEVRPLFHSFQVQSIISGMDESSIWMYQTFRYMDNDDDKNNKEGGVGSGSGDRIRAQVLIKGVTVKNRKVVDPRKFLVEHVGIPNEAVQSLSRSNSADATTGTTCMQDMMDHFESLEHSYRHAAGLDDEKVKQQQSSPSKNERAI
jgi:acyl-CoA thioesterase FadM